MQKQKNFAVYIYFIASCIVLAILQSKHFLDADEGIILDGAWNLINGRVLYTDFFEIIPPLSFYFIYWAWQLVGVSYVAARIVGIAAILVSAIGVYKISSIYVRGRLVFLAPTLFMIASLRWVLITHNVFFLPFAIGAMYFFIKSISDRSRYRLAISGILTGLGILVLHSHGLIIALVSAVFLAIQWFKNKDEYNLKSTAIYAIGVFIPVSTVLMKWDLNVLYQNLVVPIFSYGSIHYVPQQFYWFTLLIMLVLAWSLRSVRSIGVWYLLSIQLLLMLSIIPNPAYVHILFILYPFIILLPLAFQVLRTATMKLEKYVTFTLFSYVIIVIFFTAFRFTLIYPPFQKTIRNHLVSQIHEHCPGQYIYAGPFLPEIYFEARKLNPTPYYLLIPGFQPEEHFDITIARLKEYKPSCAVMNYSIVQQFRYDLSSVDYYLRDNYRINYSIGSHILFQRKGLNTEDSLEHSPGSS